MENQYTQHTHDKMVAAFDLVKDSTDWKNPIDRVISREQFNNSLIVDAVTYFTGSVPTFIVTGNSIRVRAAGYYVDTT